MARSTSFAWFAATLGVLALSADAFARDIYVPGDARNLRKAVRKAEPGDRIVLRAGRHRGKARVNVPDITIVGEAGATLKKGRLTIAADGVEVGNLSFFKVLVEANGADAYIHDNLFMGSAKRRAALEVRGDGAVVERNTFRDRRKEKKQSQYLVEMRADGGALNRNFVYGEKRAVLAEGDGFSFLANTLEAQGSGLVLTGDNASLVSNYLPAGNEFDPAAVIVGNGASLTGNSLTTGPTGIAIDGDDARLYGNIVRAETDAIVVTGNDAVLRNNDVAAESLGICVQGPGASVSGNTVVGPDTGIDVTGADADVAGNDLLFVGTGISIQGDASAVSGNTVEGAVGGVHVQGDGASVSGNTVDGASLGVHVQGSGFEITDNRFVEIGTFDGRLLPDNRCPAILVETANPQGGNTEVGAPRGGTVASNDIVHVAGNGIVVQGDRVDVCFNDVTTTNFGMQSIVVTGDDNTVEGNSSTTVGGPADIVIGGILVEGSGNDIVGNDVDGAPAEGVQVIGNSNELRANVVTGAKACGYWVEGSSNAVVDCTATDCLVTGLLNVGDDTRVTGGSFVSNVRSDVLNTGSFSLFDVPLVGLVLEGAAAQNFLQ